LSKLERLAQEGDVNGWVKFGNDVVSSISDLVALDESIKFSFAWDGVRVKVGLTACSR